MFGIWAGVQYLKTPTFLLPVSCGLGRKPRLASIYPERSCRVMEGGLRTMVER